MTRVPASPFDPLSVPCRVCQYERPYLPKPNRDLPRPSRWRRVVDFLEGAPAVDRCPSCGAL